MDQWQAQVFIKWNKDAPKMENWDWLKQYNQVKWAATTTGDWDLTLWVDANSPEELNSFINTKLKTTPWITETHFSWVKKVWAA